MNRTTKTYTAIMASDFLVWSTGTGLYPLISRMTDAHLQGGRTAQVIAMAMLAYTCATIVGRWSASRFRFEPRRYAIAASLLSSFGLVFLFVELPSAWYLGRALQGLALGWYGVNVITLTSTVLPPGRRMRGFAMIGMADFLGFSFGPVLSGLIVSRFGIDVALICFLLLSATSVWTTSMLPRLSEAPNSDAVVSPSARAPLRPFLPLALALMIGFLFHLYYGGYLPITVATDRFPVETLFFSGYIAGGFLFRLRVVDLFERLRGWCAFALTLGLIATTSLAVAAWPASHVWLEWIVVATGLGYGLGLEALYIFCLVWVSDHTPVAQRPRVYAFVFSGIEIGALIAGLSFGPLAVALGIKGLLHVILLLNLVLVPLPLLLVRWKPQRANSEVQVG